jgi:arylsulfatase A-like enzyme
MELPTARNVILVITDQQHFRTLGCTGAAVARTPNIDRLAEGGINFRNHFVANPVCSPSRATIMTGQHLTQHGLWMNGCRLPHDADTIPKAAARHGLQTAHFGKLHLEPIIVRTAKPHAYGFEVCEVAEGDQHLMHDAYFAWFRKKNPDLFVEYSNQLFAGGHVDAYTSLIPEEMSHTHWVTGRSIDWLEHRREASRPFFLSIGYFDPHHAFNPCEPYASAFADAEVPDPVFEEGAIDGKPQPYGDFFRGMQKITRDLPRMRKTIRAYHAMMAHIDANVGRLLAALARQGLSSNTAVIFTSDHGEFLGNHGLLWKGPFLLDDLLHVPMIVSLPGCPAKGLCIDDLTSAVDIKSTVLALAGAEVDGRPLVDRALKPLPHGSRSYIRADWEHPDQDKPNRSLRCVRTRAAKLIKYPDETSGELYDLENDPFEFRNLYDEPPYAALRDELETIVNGFSPGYRPSVPHEGGW